MSSMYAIVWKFMVRPEAVLEFETHYSAAGSWAKFFARSPRYLGTELLRSRERENEYLTIDRWESREDYLAFEAAHRRDYAELDQRFVRLTLAEERIGDYEES